eukprot:5310206-Alexandrium_andersonii.AAC.1
MGGAGIARRQGAVPRSVAAGRRRSRTKATGSRSPRRSPTLRAMGSGASPWACRSQPGAPRPLVRARASWPVGAPPLLFTWQP